jgi:hypothetical protein
MNTVRCTLTRVALLVTFASAAGCTFGAFPRETRDPVYRSVPPCFSGDVCGLPGR